MTSLPATCFPAVGGEPEIDLERRRPQLAWRCDNTFWMQLCAEGPREGPSTSELRQEPTDSLERRPAPQSFHPVPGLDPQPPPLTDCNQ
ncbi:hypothetical protein F2P81_021734 [Scophthalmus maximus]|uniref:Uncharacterized protein n=1 Tax=Scophthalmus maximus TaxID=52904 RepID=A0A6A4S1Y3_SCOMX|nr:hypothetical protein F2P81_021734 [Scophthalmus maximus]